MPQKKTSKKPIAWAFTGVLLLILVAIALVPLFSKRTVSIASAAEISPSQIDYVTVRINNENGASSVKKISSRENIDRLYSELSGLLVKKELHFGAQNNDSNVHLRIKMKDGETVELSNRGNYFSSKNSGPFSSFFMCYYNVEDEGKFEKIVKSLAA